jgi:hypothetical protein
MAGIGREGGGAMIYPSRQWARPYYDEIRERAGMHRDEAVERSEEIREQIQPAFAFMGRNWLRGICINGVDNPYMSEDARKVIVNDVLREAKAMGRNKARNARMKEAA